MTSFLKDISWSGVAVFVRALVSFSINKVVASTLGPAVFSLLVHFQNLLGIITFLPADGLNRAFIKHNASEERGNIFGLTIRWYVIYYVGVLGVLWLGRGVFLEWLDIELSIWFWLFFTISLGLFLLFILLLGLYQAQQNIRSFALMQLLSAVVSLLIVTGLARLAFPIYLIAFGFLVGQFSGILIWLFRPKLPSMRINKFSFKPLIPFLSMALISLFCGTGLDFLVRTYSFDLLGEFETGLWQAPYRISLQLAALVSGIVGVVFYTRVAAIIKDKKAVKNYLERVSKTLLMPVLVIAIGMAVFAEETMLLFYSRDYVDQALLLRIQLIGDILMVPSYLLAYVFLASTQTSIYIGAQVVSAFIYILIVYFGLSLLGLEVFAWAHAFRFTSFLLFLTIFWYKWLKDDA